MLAKVVAWRLRSARIRVPFKLERKRMHKTPIACARAVLAVLALLASVSAQPQGSSLTGTISDPNGAAVAEAPIQVKNKTTGAVARTTSKADGSYTLAGLAEGTYAFSIVMPVLRVQSDSSRRQPGDRQTRDREHSAHRDG